MKKILFVLFYFVCVASLYCQDALKEYNLREYFFNYRQMFKPVKYTFVNVSDSAEKVYWTVQTMVASGDTLVITQVRDTINRLTEEVVQQVTKDNILLKGYKLYDYKENKVKIRDCKVQDPSLVFKWQQHLEDSIRWNVSYYDSTFRKVIGLTKIRVFTKIDLSPDLAKFNDYYFVIAGATSLLDHQVYSYYQRKRGLVKYSYLFRTGVTKLFTLLGESRE